MTKPTVFFTDRRAEVYYNMLDKLEHVLNELNLPQGIQKGDKVMIKTHFGQWGNTNYIRPVYVRKVVELVRAAGGTPSWPSPVVWVMVTGGRTEEGRPLQNTLEWRR